MKRGMNFLNQQALDWLLEEDPINTPVRFLALRDLVGRCEGDAELEAARGAMMQTGLISAILAEQYPEGYWENDKNIYGPKYFATIWQVIMLAQSGADASHPQIYKACEYLLQKAIGNFGASVSSRTDRCCALCAGQHIGSPAGFRLPG